MRMVIVRETRRLLLTPSAPLHARQYGTSFLNQLVLNRKYDRELARMLIDTYLSLFKVQIALGDVEQRVLAGLLTGVLRALPYAEFSAEEAVSTESPLSEHVDTLYRIAHVANFSASVQAMTLLFQISGLQKVTLDRFLRLLYDSLSWRAVGTTSKPGLYLNLIYRVSV